MTVLAASASSESADVGEDPVVQDDSGSDDADSAEESVALDADTASSEDGGTDALAVVALIVGALGLIVGTGGVVLARKKG